MKYHRLDFPRPQVSHPHHRALSGSVVGQTIKRKPLPEQGTPSAARGLLQIAVLVLMFLGVVGCSWAGVFWIMQGDIFRAIVFGVVSLAIFMAAVWCPWIKW